MVKLTFYGGVKEIGGNKILLEDQDTKIFLDFGMSFGRSAREPMRNLLSFQKARAITEEKDTMQIAKGDALAALNSYNLLEERISKMSTWPMDYSQFIQVVGGVLSPFFTTILRLFFGGN